MTTTTPPIIRKVIFAFNLEKFSKTISRFDEKLLEEITVSVWAPLPDGSGKCENLLNSSLSGEEFDSLAENALYTIYEGPVKSLYAIGVL